MTVIAILSMCETLHLQLCYLEQVGDVSDWCCGCEGCRIGDKIRERDRVEESGMSLAIYLLCG